MKKKEKIPYDDAQADDLIARHGLAPTVKKVWKSRGHIPGDYLDPNRDDSEKLSDRDPEYQRFIEILSRREVAATKFRTLGRKGADVQRGKDRMTEAERLAFKAEVVEIRNKLRQAKDAPTQRNLKAALTDVRLHPTNIIASNVYSKITGGYDLQPWELQEVRVAILALYNLLRV